jgi:hypothetical protein
MITSSRHGFELFRIGDPAVTACASYVPMNDEFLADLHFLFIGKVHSSSLSDVGMSGSSSWISSPILCIHVWWI